MSNKREELTCHEHGMRRTSRPSGGEDCKLFHRSCVTLALGTTLVITACGGGSSSATSPGGPTGTGNDTSNSATGSDGTCTLSGAVSGTVPCSGTTAAWSSSIDVTTISIGGYSYELGLLVALAANIDGKPKTGTFTIDSSEYGGRATVARTPEMWSTDLAAGGSYTVTITSLGALQPYIQDDLWCEVHGTAHAVVPPGASASGVIELDATF